MKEAEDFYNEAIDKAGTLAENGVYPHMRDCMLEAMEAYKSQEENWISVKDRLPEESKHYLIYGRYTKDCPMEVQEALFYKKKRKFYIDSIISKDVTHWQYLPNPPKQ